VARVLESVSVIALPFKLGATERILSTTLNDQFPKVIAAAELYLILVQTFHANDDRDRRSVASNNDPFLLGVTNALIQRRLFNTYRFHRISSVVA
jgi:hypothetical protein